MGGCCSKGENSLQNSPSYSPITDSILMYRKPTSELSETVIAVLLDEKLTQAHQWFISCMKATLDWSKPALEELEFKDVLKKVETQARNYFRSMFVQGSSGENVPFAQIKKTEVDFERMCRMDHNLFVYCNCVKSFTNCTRLKRQLVQENTGGNKEKVLKMYDEKAQGPYARRCREDLALLLSLSGSANVLVQLETQMAMDVEILEDMKQKAQEKAKTEMSVVFQPVALEQSEGSPISKSMLQSHASVVDFIDRLLSVDNLSSSTQSYMLAGHIGSLKAPELLLEKQPSHSGEGSVQKPDIVVDTDSHSTSHANSLRGSINVPEHSENSLESRVLHIDRSTLQDLD